MKAIIRMALKMLYFNQCISEYNIVIGDMILSEIQDSSSDVFKLITDFGIETSYKIE